MKLWQIAAVVALGVGYGLLQPGRFAYAFGHATLYVFLPALLFEAAWNLNLRAVRRQWRAIATLAGPGVVLTAAIVAAALVLVRVPLGPALLCGAILSATDPIAVVAVFRHLRIPLSLATIVVCESLFNDGVAVVLYRGVLAALTVGATSAGAVATVTALTIAGALGGILLGIATALIAALALRRSRHDATQIAATLLCAYGVYFAADALHLSGVFATIAFGMAFRYYERAWIALRVVDEVDRFWELAAQAANVAVFFMAGAALQIGAAGRDWAFTVASIAAVAIARVAIAWLLLPGRYPPAWTNVVRVAGLRGGLSIALALALPAWVPYREAIVDATFAVALVTLAASGITLAPAVRRAAR